MADKRDYYEVLGLQKGASDDEIKMFPALADYNPCVSRQLNDTAAICRDEDALLNELAEISLAELWSVNKSALSGAGFDLLAPALQRRVLRKAYQLLAGDLPELSFKQVEAIRCLKNEQSSNLPRGIKAWRRGDLYFGHEMPPLPADFSFATAPISLLDALRNQLKKAGVSF